MSDPEHPSGFRNLSMRIRTFWEAQSRNRKILIVGAGTVLVLGIFALVRNGGESGGSTHTVQRGTVASGVNVAGQLAPVESVDLSFGKSGRVAAVTVKVGDRVARGALLASLDNAEAVAQLRQAEAELLTQQAYLSQDEGGGRSEEVAVEETELRLAQQELKDIYGRTHNVLSDAYEASDYALHIDIEPLFTTEGSEENPAYELSFDASCYSLEAAAVGSRARAEIAMTQWRGELDALLRSSSAEVSAQTITSSQMHLQAVRQSLNDIGALFEDASCPLGLEAETVQSYRSLVNSARSRLTNATTQAKEHAQDVAAQVLEVQRAQGELALVAAGRTDYDVAAQRAQVLAARAQVDRYRSLVSQGIIVSPIGGIVTNVDAKVGQTAPANEPLISVISDARLQVEANVPEVDIGEVAVGDTASFTVDALPGEAFTGSVATVDPAETVVDGVVNFKVTVAIADGDVRLRSGMTADLAIEGLRVSDVLIVPQRAITENADGASVQLVTGSGTVPADVVTGLKGSGGMTEIISGLSAGDIITVPDPSL